MDAQTRAKLVQIVCTKTYENEGVICVRRVRPLENNDFQDFERVRQRVISNTCSNTYETLKDDINQTPNTSNTSNTSKNIGLDVSDCIDWFEERAAILEYSQGHNRVDAERIALEWVCGIFKETLSPKMLAELTAHYHSLQKGKANGKKDHKSN